MALTLTRRIFKAIERRLVERAIEQTYAEVVGKDGLTATYEGETQSAARFARILEAIPQKEERKRRLNAAAKDALHSVIDEVISNMKDTEVVDFQFEAGEIARLAYSRRHAKGINFKAHLLILERLRDTGRLINFEALFDDLIKDWKETGGNPAAPLKLEKVSALAQDGMDTKPKKRR